MRCPFLFLFVIIYFSSYTYCQSAIEKGTFSVNGNISFVSNYEEDNILNSTIFIFNPGFDYFIIDNLSIGIKVNYQNISYGISDNSSWGIGPSARYYFDVQHIKPFLGIGYSFTQQNAAIPKNKIKQNNLILSLGADYFLTSNVALETLVSYSFENIKLPQSYNAFYSKLERQRKSLSIGIGINVFIR